MNEFEPIRAAVQHNCHISDARYGRQDTLCIYLLKMREFFRWERGFGFGERLPKEEIGDWIVEREQLWETVEENDFAPIEIDGTAYDPFEAEPINEALAERGLVYSAGLGRHAKPSFFLGRQERSERIDGFRVRVAGEEYARDLAAPPAMLQGETIYVRRASLARAIWEKIEENGGRAEHPIRRAMAFARFDENPRRALAEMTERELEYAIAHELGEGLAGRRLGPEWEAMLLAIASSRNEIIARAVRDNLADSLTTLPRLLEDEAIASIHFYFANLGGMRKALHPRLVEGYRRFTEGGDLTAIAKALEGSEAHWTEAARRMLAIHAEEGWESAGCLTDELTR
ncbi:Sfum_1244 family protein [Endothiovibrio diazotrophicus]